MVRLYILEIINNGRVVQAYQDENIEEIFDTAAEEFDGLGDFLHDEIINLIDVNFDKKKLEKLKENQEMYNDIYMCMKDFITEENYKNFLKIILKVAGSIIKSVHYINFKRGNFTTLYIKKE